MTIHSERFGHAIWNAITDPEIKRLRFFGGSLNQFSPSTTTLDPRSAKSSSFSTIDLRRPVDAKKFSSA